MVTGTLVPEAVFLTPNEYQTINKMGRMKNATYQIIDGTASANDGPFSRRFFGGGNDGVVNMSNAAGGREIDPIDMSPPSRSWSVQHHEPAAALILL
jgi:hypothetical protein